MGLQLRMKRQADEIIPLLKASSYRCKGAPLYDAYSPDPRHKAILYKTGLAIVVGLCVRAPCLSLFAVAHCGSITGHPEVGLFEANLTKNFRAVEELHQVAATRTERRLFAQVDFRREMRPMAVLDT